jgi:predicted membrane protein
MSSNKLFATEFQKENFKTTFEAIVQKNDKLNSQFKIQFFDTIRTNYVISGLDGKSINVTESMSDDELELYRALKSNWQKLKL